MGRVYSGIALVFAAVACSESATPFDPATFVGQYTLRTVNGLTLPQSVATTPQGCSASFRYGTLTLADRAFTLDLDGIWGICPNTPDLAAVRATRTIGGGLEVSGRTVRLRAVDPTSPSGAPMSLEGITSGAAFQVIVPTGTMKFGDVATLGFARNQPLP